STTLRIAVSGTTSLMPADQQIGRGQPKEPGPDAASADRDRPVRFNNSNVPSEPGPGVLTASASIAKSNPELSVSFDGLRMIDSRLADNGHTFATEPPDQGICAGNGFVLESI